VCFLAGAVFLAGAAFFAGGLFLAGGVFFAPPAAVVFACPVFFRAALPAGAAGRPAAPFLAAVLVTAVFLAGAAFLAGAFFAADVLVVDVLVVDALAVLAAGAGFFGAAGALRAGRAVFAAVRFTTMDAAPSHFMILSANRAGTINRLLAFGNGPRRRFARRAVSIRCAQLLGG
jgi:hypothetical protein